MATADPPPDSGEVDKEDSAEGLAIGLGVAGGVVVLLIVAAAMYWYLVRENMPRRGSGEEEMDSPSASDSESKGLVSRSAIESDA